MDETAWGPVRTALTSIYPVSQHLAEIRLVLTVLYRALGRDVDDVEAKGEGALKPNSGWNG